MDYLLDPSRTRVMPAFFVLMLLKTPLKIGGYAGIDALVRAKDKINEIHIVLSIS